MIVSVALGIATVAVSVNAATVNLRNGDILSGEVLQQTEKAVTLKHAVIGEVTVPRGQIAKAEGLPEPKAEKEAATEAPAKDKAQADAEQTGAAPAKSKADEPADDAPDYWEAALLPNWDKSVALGFSGTEGNSENQSVNAQFQLKRNDDEQRVDFSNKYFFATSRGDTTQNELNSELTVDWLFPDTSWFIFTQTGYEFDQFESWRHRVSGYLGPGYTFVDNDDLEIVARGGAGANYEFGQINDLTPEALLGSEVITWKLTDNQTLTGKATIYPDLEELSEFRLVSNAEWKVKINRAEGLSLKFGVENEYESITPGNSKHNDFKYYGALDYAF
jgi:putative salt-induced outer membrane protein YdiY